MRFFCGDFDKEEIEELKKKGKFVYDLRGYDDFSEGNSFFATIEPSVWVNNMGQIVTSEEIEFKQIANDKYVDYEEFAEENEEVDDVEDV